MRNLIGIIIASLIASGANAKVILPYIFSSGMVLQQQTNAAIWGKSTPSTWVNVVTSWNKKDYKVKVNADSTWKLKIETPSAGGPYEITIIDNSSVVLKDILIGEVWFISGQSNMEMGLRGMGPEQPIRGGLEAIASANNDYIRFFRSQHKIWAAPTDNLRGRWQSASPMSAPLFSALGYFFATKLYAQLKVPIGIVQVAYGGTPIEAWMSRESLQPFVSEVKLPEVENETIQNKATPTGLFNGMINPMVGFTIKGMLWYQGEHNRRYPQLYAKLFPAMVADWRKRWDIGEFPFYYVQIAPYPMPANWMPYSPFLREAQLNSLKVIPNSGMVVNVDLGSEKVSHTPFKEKIADRMLPLVLNKTYGFKDFSYQGPLFKSLIIKGNTAILKFDFAENGLKFSQEINDNFEVAGNDRKFYPASSVKIKGNTIEVVATQVANPVAARYAFKGWVVGNLYNTEGLPASSFRTDQWEIPL